MSAIMFSLKTIKSLQNEVAYHFQMTPLFSIRVVSLASLQSCCIIDADVWCKRTFILKRKSRLRLVHTALNLMLTLSSDKDQRKNRFRSNINEH